MVNTNTTDDIKDFLNEYKTVKRIEKIQRNIKLPVRFMERKKRVQELLKIKKKGEKILQKITNGNKISKNIVGKIQKIIEKSDHQKRENCMLQVNDVVGILKPNELCIFREKSRNDIIEIRKYFGLNKNLYYDEGLSVSMAVTLPKLIQNYHSHLEMQECTSVLTGKLCAKWKSNEGIKTINAKQGDSLVIKPYTIHTILNKCHKIGLNATVKIPIGFSDRKNYENLPKNANGDIKLLKTKIVKRSWGKIKSFKRKVNSHTYKVDFLYINPSDSVTFLLKNDSYTYVAEESAIIEFNGNKKIARANNLIFVSKKLKHKIKNRSGVKTLNLYRVREL